MKLSDLSGAARERARAALAAERLWTAKPLARSKERSKDGALCARRPAAARSAPRAAPCADGAPHAPTGPLVFVLPMPPALLSRAHSATTNGRVIAREKRAYSAALDARQAAGLIPPPPVVPFARARLSAVMVLGGMMDEENAAARAYKFPCDWLQSRGYIVNDRPTCLTRDGYPTQRVTRKEPASLTLTLTPLEP